MKKKPLVPYFCGISPSRYVKLYFSTSFSILIWLEWAQTHNYSAEEINDFFSIIYLPYSIGLLLIPILYAIHYIFYKGNLNRSNAFSMLSLKNNLDYKKSHGFMIPDIKNIVSSYPFFTTFFGIEKPSKYYIIQKKDTPYFYMFDYAYPILSRNVKYTFHKTVFIVKLSGLDLPNLQVKPSSLFDFMLRKNLKAKLPKAYIEKLSGYSFWFDIKNNSHYDMTKIIPLELLPLIQANKGLVIEYFSNHLIVNFKNCRIPSYNLSKFFDLGVSIKNTFLKNTPLL